MKKIIIILVSLIFIGGFAEPINAAPPAPPDATYLRLDSTNQSSWTPTTSLVTNLNADLWDGYHFADYLNQAVKSTSSPVFLGLTVGTNTLFVDFVNDRLGINTSSPVYPLDCVGDINTSTVYRIGGATVLNVSGEGNIFAGINSGSTGRLNTFVGAGSGALNSTGSENTFIGAASGFYNSTGYANVFVGYTAGQSNTAGQLNTFLGHDAGKLNTTGKGNTFVGLAAGLSNATADFNTYLGNSAGDSNTTGFENTFLGNQAGTSNTTGSRNIFIGSGAMGTSGTIASSIGIGCNTVVTANNQLVVGSSWNPVRITDSYWGNGVTNNFPSAFTFNATGGEGTDNVGADLKIAGGKGTGAANGGKIIFQTAPAGPAGTTPNALVDRVTITSDGNVAIGTATPTAVLDVNGTTGYNQLRVRTAFTPTGTADSNGNTGDIAWDDDYVYIKTSVGWKRAALGTW